MGHLQAANNSFGSDLCSTNETLICRSRTPTDGTFSTDINIEHYTRPNIR